MEGLLIKFASLDLSVWFPLYTVTWNRKMKRESSFLKAILRFSHLTDIGDGRYQLRNEVIHNNFHKAVEHFRWPSGRPATCHCAYPPSLQLALHRVTTWRVDRNLTENCLSLKNTTLVICPSKRKPISKEWLMWLVDQAFLYFFRDFVPWYSKVLRQVRKKTQRLRSCLLKAEIVRTLKEHIDPDDVVPPEVTSCPKSIKQLGYVSRRHGIGMLSYLTTKCDFEDSELPNSLRACT